MFLLIETFSDFWLNHSETAINAAYNIVLSIIILIASSVVARAVTRTIRKANDRLEKFDADLVPVLCTVATYGIYIIGALFILDIFGINTSSIVAILAASVVAIGLALQNTLSNIAAGFMLLFLRPFRTGEAIEFGSIQGTVREINLFTTTLETFDGLHISSPNSVIWASSIKNFSRNGRRRMDVLVGIDYADSIDRGLEVLKKVAASEKRFLADPAPSVLVVSLGDSSVNLRLRAWASVDDYWATFWDMNKIVKEEIEAAGLSIPFPQHTVHMAAGEPEASRS